MNFLRVIALGGLVVLSPASFSQATTEEIVVVKPGWLTGNSYQALSELQKRSFVIGFVDGLFVAPVLRAPKSELAWLERCTPGKTDAQLVAIVDRWLAVNPSRLQEQINMLAFQAFVEACRT